MKKARVLIKSKEYYKNKIRIVIYIVLGVLVFILPSAIMVANDMGNIFDSWGLQSDGTMVYPDARYIWLIVSKLSLYLLPPVIGSIGFTYENKDNVSHLKYPYYCVKAINFHFMILLILKLSLESIFEVDRIFNFTIFSSIEDVQTLIGYVFTLFLIKQIKESSTKKQPPQNVEIKPGIGSGEVFKK